MESQMQSTSTNAAEKKGPETTESLMPPSSRAEEISKSLETPPSTTTTELKAHEMAESSTTPLVAPRSPTFTETDTHNNPGALDTPSTIVTDPKDHEIAESSIPHSTAPADSQVHHLAETSTTQSAATPKVKTHEAPEITRTQSTAAEHSTIPSLTETTQPQSASAAADTVISDAAPVNTGESMASGISDDSEDSANSALEHLNVDFSEDHDSALGDMTPQTSTMSVRSSIYNYVEENGRTYHRYKEGKYYLPNDESEQDRLDLQHQLWLLTCSDELYLAPIRNLHNVLDIGTGTGIWAIEFANRNPSACVVGSDLSPIQPAYIPPNCHFEVDDAEDDWNYSQKFDLIHGRAMFSCFNDPYYVIKSAFDALSPGGYLELQDMVLPMRSIDNTLTGTALESWLELTMSAAVKLGRNWTCGAYYKQYMEDAGFVDVVERHFQWPMNTWPKGKHMKTLGIYWQADMLKGLEALSMAVLTRGAGLTKEQVLELTTEVTKNIFDRGIHAYLPVIVVYGRKPDGLLQ